MKVMIVEDDLLVRLGIKSMIAWGELGMEVVCEARDGAEAIELYSRHLPDIALVDIGLPKMDGLDFIGRVKPLKPDGEFVILTCNKDFELVRRSLRLGVRDFFVKSTMEIGELQAMLQGLTEQLGQRRQPGADGDSAELRQLRQIRRAALLREWLGGLYDSGPEFLGKLAEDSLLPEGPLEAWIVRLNTTDRHGKPLLPADLNKLGRAVENVAAELYRGRLIGFVDEVANRRWHALVQSADGEGAPDARLLVDAVERYLGLSVTIAASEPFACWQDWNDADREARELLGLSFYEPERRLLRRERPEATIPLPLLAWKRNLMQRLTRFQWEEAARMLDSAAGLRPYPRPGLMLDLLAEVASRLDRIGERMGVRSERREAERGAGLAIAGCATLAEGLERIRERIARLRESCGRSGSRRRLIDAVELYLDEIGFEEISLNKVAALFDMSPAQLSRIFKEEKGMNFSDAVLAAKVEQAERMMEIGMSLSDIADRLGYLNPSSFTRMFKKIRGVAPSYYADSQSR